MLNDNNDRADRNAYVALGLLFGTMVGIGIGMLVAPRSGQETRRLLKVRAVAAKQGAQRQLARKREAAMGALSKSLDKSKELVEKSSHHGQSAQSAPVQGRPEGSGNGSGIRARRAPR